ncbi:MAG TPA: hypothetical protein VGC67_16015 [Cellulomonas sp.]
MSDADEQADGRAPVRAGRLRRWGRVLRWTAAVCLAGTVLLLAVPAGGTPLVLGSHVPRTWHLALLLALVGTVAAPVGWVCGACARDRGAPAGDRRWFVRWPVNVAKGALLVLGWGAAVLHVLTGTISTYWVLDPPSADGCRVVVREVSFLLVGWGEVWLLPDGALRPTEVAGYTADDGYAPVSRGTATLTWTGETAELVLTGTPDQPVVQDGTTFDCAALD